MRVWLNKKKKKMGLLTCKWILLARLYSVLDAWRTGGRPVNTPPPHYHHAAKKYEEIQRAYSVEEREKREPGHCWCSDSSRQARCNDAKTAWFVRVVSSIVLSKSIKGGKEPSKPRRKQTTGKADNVQSNEKQTREIRQEKHSPPTNMPL